MVVGFMNGVLCFCRTPGIMVGKSMKRWTSTGKNCCRKRLVVFSVLFLYLWYLLLTCMWHPVWCCLSFIEQLISPLSVIFWATNFRGQLSFSEGKHILYFIFHSTFFSRGCDRWSGWGFFTFNFHPCMPEQATEVIDHSAFYFLIFCSNSGNC
jgi:hypothetical protein